MDEPPLVIEPLGRQHDRSAFSCGQPALDTYLQRQATQDVRRSVAEIFVALGDTPKRIAGYYSLSAASFEKSELPAQLSKRLPHYPVPAAVLGRLAVDRVVGTSRYAVAKNDRAKEFYERYGFIALASCCCSTLSAGSCGASETTLALDRRVCSCAPRAIVVVEMPRACGSANLGEIAPRNSTSATASSPLPGRRAVCTFPSKPSRS